MSRKWRLCQQRVWGGGGADDQSVQRSHSRWDSDSSNETEQPRAAELWAYGTIAIDSSQQKPKEVDHPRQRKGESRPSLKSLLCPRNTTTKLRTRPQHFIKGIREIVCVWSRERENRSVWCFCRFCRKCVASIMTLHDLSFLGYNLICYPAEHCDFLTSTIALIG